MRAKAKATTKPKLNGITKVIPIKGKLPDFKGAVDHWVQCADHLFDPTAMEILGDARMPPKQRERLIISDHVGRHLGGFADVG